MKKATSTTTWEDAVGTRMSITYSEIDEETGKIISDNKRQDHVLTDRTIETYAKELLRYAQERIDSE